MIDPSDALATIITSKKVCITPAEAASVLQCAPYALNQKAKANALPFRAFFVGNRLLIPRIPFLEYLGYESER